MGYFSSMECTLSHVTQCSKVVAQALEPNYSLFINFRVQGNQAGMPLAESPVSGSRYFGYNFLISSHFLTNLNDLEILVSYIQFIHGPIFTVLSLTFSKNLIFTNYLIFSVYQRSFRNGLFSLG